MKFVHVIDRQYQISTGIPKNRPEPVTFECTAVAYDAITTKHWAFVGLNEVQAMESTRELFKSVAGEYPYLIFIHDTTKCTKV